MSIKISQIYSPDGMTQCGNISHFWNQVQVEYTLGLQFPSPNTDTKKKALLLGAAFLLVSLINSFNLFD